MSSGEGCVDRPDPTDRSLVDAIDRLRRGLDVERNARIVHDRFYGALRRYFAHKVPFAQDREDLTQETFLAAFREIGSYRGDARFSTWLFRIALNTYRRWQRRQERSQRLSSRSWTPPILPHETASRLEDLPEPLGGALESERCRLLAEAIAELPTQQKRCIVAMFLQQRTHREVALMLGLSPATVKSHVYHARRSLERALGGYGGVPIPPPVDHGEGAP